MKRIILGLLIVSVIASAGMSQDYAIKKVWEFLPTQENPAHPWLKAQSGTNSEHDGANTMDFSSTLIRYDENRLMLFLLENGIDEANASDADKAVAEQYPDRSILWIDPDTGASMGVALTIGLQPTPDSEYYIQKCTGTHPDGPTSDRSWQLIEQWPQIGVDGDGYLYYGDKHKILRYLPDGNGGFTGPEIVFRYPEQDPPVWAVSEELHYRAWCIRSLNVKGSGDNKVMTTAARFWIDGGGIIYYTSDDGGASWTMQTHRGQDQRGGIGTGGAATLPVIDENMGEEWIFGNGFPGSDDRLYRFIRPADTTEDFQQDIAELWDPTEDPAEISDVEKYKKWNMIDVAAADGAPYIAVLTLPKWQSRNPPESNPEWEEATAWVALHSISLDPNDDFIEGDFLSSYQIAYREKDELQGVAGDEDNWDAAYLATINMSVPDGYPEGAAEILWSGGVSGFGRLVVGDVEIPTHVNEWSLF
ncbi:MAG: hypothetical protein JXR73_00410 [Candidatus Omnitrophica bacterium]|nr:hypothetical protein [Candidatus Omnitrophota bacterium]